MQCNLLLTILCGLVLALKSYDSDVICIPGMRNIQVPSSKLDLSSFLLSLLQAEGAPMPMSHGDNECLHAVGACNEAILSIIYKLEPRGTSR